MSIESKVCLHDCSLRKMAEESCCTNNVGFGTKLLRSRSGGRIEVCSMIEIDPDTRGLYCNARRKTPVECRSFFCEDALEARYREA